MHLIDRTLSFKCVSLLFIQVLLLLLWVPWPRKEENGVDETKLTNGSVFDEVDRTRSWTDSIEQYADHAGTLMQVRSCF